MPQLAAKPVQPGDETGVATPDFDIIDATRKLGAKLISLERQGHQVSRDLISHVALSILSNEQQLKRAARAAGIEKPKSEYPDAPLVAYLKGADCLDETVTQAQRDQFNNEVGRVATIVYGIRQQFVGREFTGTKEELETVTQHVSTRKLNGLINDGRKALKDATNSNKKSISSSDVIDEILKAYAAGTPRGKLKSQRNLGAIGEVKFCAVKVTAETEADLVDFTKASAAILSNMADASQMYPMGGVEARENQFFDLLRVAQAVPDTDSATPINQTGDASSGDTEYLPNLRQFVFDPHAQRVTVGHPRSDSHVVIHSSWPDRLGLENKISKPVILEAKSRKKADLLCGRRKRGGYELQWQQLSKGQKALAKLGVIDVADERKEIDLHFFDYSRHSLEILDFDADRAEWAFTTTLSDVQFLKFLDQHLLPYAETNKSEKKGRVLSFAFEDTHFTFEYQDSGPIKVDAETEFHATSSTKMRSLGEDWVRVFDALSYLDLTQTVTIKGDPKCAFCVSAKTAYSEFEAFIPLVQAGSEERLARGFAPLNLPLVDAEDAPSGNSSSEEEAAAEPTDQDTSGE